MLIESAGWSHRLATERFGIVGWPLVATRASFTAACVYGDDVSITSNFATVRTSSFAIGHVLARGGLICVEAFETRVWTRQDRETGRLSSAPLPSEVIASFGGPQTPSAKPQIQDGTTHLLGLPHRRKRPRPAAGHRRVSMYIARLK